MTLLPPRWPNGPPICEAANLCAFETVEALNKFRGAMYFMTSPPQVRISQCEVCGYFHYSIVQDEAHESLSIPSVLLTSQEIAQCEAWGKHRNDVSNEAGLKSQNVSRKSDEYIHVLGAFGECACCKILGLPFRLSVNTFRKADLPHNIEVRTRAERWQDCKIRVDDDDSRRVVMVIVEDPKHPCLIPGWITAKEGKAFGLIDPRNKAKPFHAVPQNRLRKIEELQAIIAMEET